MPETGGNPYIIHDGDRHAFTFPADAADWLRAAGWETGDGTPARIALWRAYQLGPAPLVTGGDRTPITVETTAELHSIVITEHPHRAEATDG